MTRRDLEALQGLLREASLSLMRKRVGQAEEAVTDAMRRIDRELDARRLRAEAAS